MRISKGLISVVSMASAMLLLCSCTVYDLGLSEGQIEKVISQIENEAQLSSEAASSEKNAEAPSSVAAASFSEAPKETGGNSNSENTAEESEISDNDNALINPDIFEREPVPEEPALPETGFTNIHKITNADDLNQFANAVMCGHSYAGEQVTLEADIDLAGIEWTPIGVRGRAFKGEFIGNGHTISNLTITSLTDKMTDARGYEACVGFFGYAEDAVIRGITLENINISIPKRNKAESLYVGAVAGSMFAVNRGIEISECKATGNISVSSDDLVFAMTGGIVGGFDANYKGTYYRMSLLYSAVNIAVKGETVTCGGITGILNSRNSKPTDSYVTEIVYIGSIDEANGGCSYTGGLCGIYNSAFRCDIKNAFINLEIKRTQLGPYTFIGIVSGDQCVATGDLGLENVYGMITCNGKNMKMSMLGRKNGNVYFKNCTEADRLPDDASFNAEKWDLSDRAFPKPYF